GLTLEQIFSHVNNQLTEDLPDNRFVTVFLGRLDSLNHQVHILSGGQAPILLFRHETQECEIINATHMPMGILEAPPPGSPHPNRLNPGDILALISDGIFEATNPSDKAEFGKQRVCDVIREHQGSTAVQIVEEVSKAVFRYTECKTQADDMTVFIVKRRPDSLTPNGR
ncbi:MAG: PP2C family protein-serine/threonine phosphatase, partial [Planctomycetota bacterium]